jgi:hypothetical protein
MLTFEPSTGTMENEQEQLSGGSATFLSTLRTSSSTWPSSALSYLQYVLHGLHGVLWRHLDALSECSWMFRTFSELPTSLYAMYQESDAFTLCYFCCTCVHRHY